MHGEQDIGAFYLASRHGHLPLVDFAHCIPTDNVPVVG